MALCAPARRTWSMVIRSYSARPTSTAATSAKNRIGANKANSTADTPASLRRHLPSQVLRTPIVAAHDRPIRRRLGRGRLSVGVAVPEDLSIPSAPPEPPEGKPAFLAVL